MHLGGSTRGEIVQPIMELRNLNVYYGDFHAVRDISLDVGANQITAFIGPSGCGKSTVLLRSKFAAESEWFSKSQIHSQSQFSTTLLTDRE